MAHTLSQNLHDVERIERMIAMAESRRNAALRGLTAIGPSMPKDRDTLLALVTFSRDAGDLVAALEYAERLARLVPGDRDVANLVRSLQSQLQKPDGR